MNIVFIIICLASIVLLTFTNPSAALPTMLDGATGAVALIFKLLAIYMVWLSVLKMMEKTGLDKKITSAFKPIAGRLFKGESEEATKFASINLVGNMLGMGGAATPAGIKAIAAMDRDGSKNASDNMILLVVLNTTSVQLFPATIVALRSVGGSADAADIVLPSIIATLCSTLIGFVLCKLCARLSARKSDRKNLPKIGAKMTQS